MPRAGSACTLADPWLDLVVQVQTRAPIRPEALNWVPEEIILTRGCDRRPHEAVYCERLIAAYPGVKVTDARHIPHNRVLVPGAMSLSKAAHGKRTLVLGAIGSPVSRNCDPETEAGTLCTHYHAVHPTWHCFYDCAFCYLSGSPGVRFSPTVRVFTNLQDILASMARTLAQGSDPPAGPAASRSPQTQTGRLPVLPARSAAGTVSFYVGKVQDGLQLDPIANFSRALVPFVQAHEKAHLVFLTKSDAVEGLLASRLDNPAGQTCRPDNPVGQVAMSWSLSAPEISAEYEWGAASFERRLDAARRCAQAGLRVRYIFMPLLPVSGWREAYSRAVKEAFAAAMPERVTLGAICSYPAALSNTRARLGKGHIISSLATTAHGRRLRFEPALRGELYGHMIREIRRLAPGVPVSLCLESEQVWRMVGLDPTDCRCNCIAGSCDVTHP